MSVISVSSSNMVKLRTDVDRTNCVSCQFCDNRHSGNQNFVHGHKWISVGTVDMYRTILVKIDIKDLHVMILSICGFRENPGRKVSTFVIGVGELHSRLYCESWHFESQGRLHKVCTTTRSVLFSLWTDFSNIFFPEPFNIYQNRCGNSRFACIFTGICIAIIEIIL